MNELSNKVAIITGGGSGIGRETATLFAERGAAVVVADLDRERAAALARQLESKGHAATSVACDVSTAGGVEQLAATTRDTYGALHILVNNAAAWRGDGRITELEEDAWDRIVDGTLKSVFLCTKFAIPEMIKAGGGSVINISSVNAIVGIALTAYTAAKAGVIGLTRLVASEYGKDGVRVNAIVPGTIKTESFEEAWKDKQAELAEFTEQYPLRTLGTPQEIARWALHLASDDSRFTTGSVVVVDGGLSSGRHIRF
jgi:3-oxoacyl-[acyl-carrier protein] reductase